MSCLKMRSNWSEHFRCENERQVELERGPKKRSNTSRCELGEHKLKKKQARSRLLATLFILLFTVGLLDQEATCSRKFLTGLIIGALLSRQALQQGPYYPIPAPSYQGGSQQQPLFIIIPSAGGKPAYRSAHATPPAYASLPVQYADPYQLDQSYEHSTDRRFSSHRLSQARRRRQKRPTRTPGHDQYQLRPPSKSTSAPAVTRLSRKLAGAREQLLHKAGLGDSVAYSNHNMFDEQVRAPILPNIHRRDKQSVAQHRPTRTTYKSPQFGIDDLQPDTSGETIRVGQKLPP